MNRHDDVRDVRELFGLRTPAAIGIVVAFVVTFAIVALATVPAEGAIAAAGAWLALSIGAVAIVRVPGDPIPLPWTIYLTLLGPVSAGVVFPFFPAPIEHSLQTWPLAAATAIYTYMCVRGRTPWAVSGTVAMIATCAVWSQLSGEGAAYGLSISVINLAPVAMAIFFAWTIRPAARDIFDLRTQTINRTAAEAADIAVLEERDRQLAHLDDLARPLLRRLSAGAPLTAPDQDACALLEAELRDSIRAPALADPRVTAAARDARSRGVEVVLLDDHGLDDASDLVRDRVLNAVAEVLERAGFGTLTIRILPPRRHVLVTIVHSTPNRIGRFEYGHDGHPVAGGGAPQPEPEPGPEPRKVGTTDRTTLGYPRF